MEIDSVQFRQSLIIIYVTYEAHKESDKEQSFTENT